MSSCSQRKCQLYNSNENMEKIFINLIDRAVKKAEENKEVSRWDTKHQGNCLESIVFANITFTLNNEIVTGEYEFFNACPKHRKEIIRKVINASFEDIGSGKCFSFYKYLTEKRIRYARVIKTTKRSDKDVCRFSGGFLDDDINGNGKNITIVSSKDARSRISQSTKTGEVYLSTILDYYDKYREAIFPRTSQRVFFYLVRPSIDNEKLDGLIYFASIKKIDLRELKDIAVHLSDVLVDIMFDKVRKEAIKSAVSAIMSRNMSHNLGSHYLYYTKAYLEKRAAREKDIAPDIRGAAKVLGYIQSRMDYLATVISNDKYPYGAVNFKSQIYDELTVDDFSHRHFPLEKNKRTTNFLLSNLIQSENYTRSDVRDDSIPTDFHNLLSLRVKYLCEGSKFADFTGTWTEVGMSHEQVVKNSLSSLNIALPGGIMSCHAFFNIVENLVRNSAKYLVNDISSTEGLVCTIAIRPNKRNKKLVDIIVYDNKNNANSKLQQSNAKELPIDDKTLYDQLLARIGNLEIVDSYNRISKENKGFKEILFSSVWMCAYKFGDKSYSDIMSEINNEKNSEEKLKLIEYYGFTLVKVVQKKNGGINVYNRHSNYDRTSNLGIQVTIPLFNNCQKFSLNEKTITKKDINSMLNVMADIVEVDNSFLESDYKHVFTRPLLFSFHKKTVLEKYKLSLKNRFPMIDNYALGFEHKEKDSYRFVKDYLYRKYTDLEDKEKDYSNDKYKIYFKRHLNTQDEATEYQELAYADTVSGGDFTVTLEELFRNGINEDSGTYKTDIDELFALKIKESALTRITVIDERLFNSTPGDYYPWLQLKNIRILNYVDEDNLSESIKEKYRSGSSSALSLIFEGSEFRNSEQYLPNQTHFLSIHLGLIEKILKNSFFVNDEINKIQNCPNYAGNNLDDKRVKTFIKMLYDYFGGIQGDLYIAIHSGRGNYSAELEGPLNRFPFISLSALESAYNNSKFQLSQLFYNTVYIGKGFANSK